MTHRSGDKRMCPGPHQFMMQRVAKTARLINGMDPVPSVHLGPNPAEQACAGEALPPLDVTSTALDRRHRIIQIHIQAMFENLPRSRIATSQRGVRLIVVMKGWGCFIFHNLRVPSRHTPCNPSWHLTAPERFVVKAVAAAAALILAMTAQALPLSYLIELERAKIEPAAKLFQQECGDHTDSQACKEQRDALVKVLNGFVSMVRK